MVPSRTILGTAVGNGLSNRRETALFVREHWGRAVMSRICVALMLAAPLVACTQPGDFGRLRHAPPAPELAFVGKHFAKFRHEPVSDYLLTDEEKRLRSIAFRFLRLPGEDGIMGSTLAEYRLARIIPMHRPFAVASSYYVTLKADEPLSSSTIWTRLGRDIRADDDMIAPFATFAHRVMTADRSRHQASYELGLLEISDLNDVVARIAENHRLVIAVREALLDRIAAYEYAMDKARLEVPDIREHEAYLALVDLKYRVGYIDEIIARYEAFLAGPPGKGAGKMAGMATAPMPISAARERPLTEAQ